MKLRTTILCMMAAVAVCSTTAFRDAGPDKSLAKADQIEGIYIFTNCKPVQAYDYQGTVSQPTFVRNDFMGTYVHNLVKKLKEKYPSADGLLITDEDAKRGL